MSRRATTRPIWALSALLGILASSSADAVRVPEPTERFQHQIEIGDVAALDEARLEIQRSIAVGGLDDEQIAARRYDWAYLNWRVSNIVRASDRKRGKALLKEAEQQLDLLLEREPDNAEAHALKGTVIGDRITGALSGALLGRKSSASHKQALELAPENPRVALLRGVGFYYTPKTFGGGSDVAEEELRRAVELFGRQPDGTNWPNWGRTDAFAWLGIVLTDRGAVDEARSLYQRALALQPENVWIRDELLPSLSE